MASQLNVTMIDPPRPQPWHDIKTQREGVIKTDTHETILIK
ncbi:MULTISPECIES: hypothetical protein [Psychrobacter]|nr:MULTISPECIES: hypothetical protein [Psychrobacter]